MVAQTCFYIPIETTSASRCDWAIGRWLAIDPLAVVLVRNQCDPVELGLSGGDKTRK